MSIELRSPSFFRRVVSLGSKGRIELGYTLNCRRRGYYTLGPLNMTTSDLFGFEENTLRWSHDDHITVYPEIVPLKKIGLPSVSPFASLPSGPRLFEDPARVIGVRDYHAGDSPRHINWKTSAAASTLLVKRYEPAIALDTMIFLDLFQPDYEGRARYWASELAIVAAASIAHYLIERRQSVGLITNGGDPLAEGPIMPGPRQRLPVSARLPRPPRGTAVPAGSSAGPAVVPAQRPRLRARDCGATGEVAGGVDGASRGLGVDIRLCLTYNRHQRRLL